VDAVRIKDFQSLADVELELGRLSVLVGPSNSGKSAVLRAIKALTHNVSSPATIVRHGAKKATVAIGIGDPEGGGGYVVFERGKSLSQYHVDGPGIGADLPRETYAKAGTSVPDDIAKLFRFVEVEGEDLNFALQFDRPFLLDAPATKVAKVLGDLTGITTIYEAVREANRRRLEITARLKVRRSDVTAIRERFTPYIAVNDRYEAVQRASTFYWSAVAHDARATAIDARIDIVTKADAAIAGLAAVPSVPSLDGLGARFERLRDLEQLVATVLDAGERERAATEALVAFDTEIKELQDAHHAALIEEGVCPTCGRPM
jgi:energy-coupling factor transporter ATP-binding protein EcfA2